MAVPLLVPRKRLGLTEAVQDAPIWHTPPAQKHMPWTREIALSCPKCSAVAFGTREDLHRWANQHQRMEHSQDPTGVAYVIQRPEGIKPF